MRFAILAGVAGAGLLAPPAHACTSLPAPSAKSVPITIAKVSEETQRTMLRVCVDGRTVTLARATSHQRRGRTSGDRIGAASAAGHRVAWIEERHRGATRTAVVTVASVGRKLHVLQRFTTQRERTRQGAEVDVLLTRRGDLAWTAGTYDGRTGIVAVRRPGKPMHRLSARVGARLAIEDGRTLRWDVDDATFGFFDLRAARCPSRSRYKPSARNDRVILTRGFYDGDDPIGHTVIRACDPSTGRDRVIMQNAFDFGYESYLTFVGLDRNWAVFLQAVSERDGPGPTTLTVADALTGRTSVARIYSGDPKDTYPPPTAGAFAVTDRGVLAWASQGALYALLSTQKIVVVDQGGVIAGLRAEGDAVAWTHDGAPRSAVF